MGDRVGDQVREGDPLARVLELLAAPLERGDGERAERGRGRDRAALVHVAGERGGATLDQLGAGGLGCRRRRLAAVAGPPLPGGQHVGLGDPAAARAAVHAGEIDPLLGGDAPRDRRDVGAVVHGGRRGRG